MPFSFSFSDSFFHGMDFRWHPGGVVLARGRVPLALNRPRSLHGIYFCHVFQESLLPETLWNLFFEYFSGGFSGVAKQSTFSWLEIILKSEGYPFFIFIFWAFSEINSLFSMDSWIPWQSMDEFENVGKFIFRVFQEGMKRSPSNV